MSTDWVEANQRYLCAALASVRSRLEQFAARQDPERARSTLDTASEEAVHTARAEMAAPPALETLCSTFALSPFERDILLMAAGAELDSRFPSLYASMAPEPRRAFPNFSIALATLPEAHWSALAPTRPLRHWRLLEVGAGESLALSPLRINERVLNYLTGVQHLDEHLASIVECVEPRSELLPSQAELAEKVVAVLQQAPETGRLPAVQLCSPSGARSRSVAAAACDRVGLRLYVVSAQALPLDVHEMSVLARVWSRDAALDGCGLLIECGDLDPGDHAREFAIGYLADRVEGIVLISGRVRRSLPHRQMVIFDVPRPSTLEQRTLWLQALGEDAPSMAAEVDELVAQFQLDAYEIRTACTAAMAEPRHDRDLEYRDALWDACRAYSRPRIEDLAQRILPVASWDELILPEPQLAILRDTVVHVRRRGQVYERWGFAAKSSRGLGTSALFAGPSGTGKTMAAEVLANELRLDLYCIDLSQVVSKYIGETEKNLRQVFDAAEGAGAILLFDEADALFGKRSEVKDSHDRYANVEISYLLQRMENYRGLAILTTNMREALDSAFLRRLRFVVQFPFPDAAQRALIWQHVFPAATPLADLAWHKLARLNVAGGSIHNIALNAAFLAAGSGEPVTMRHLLAAARLEYAKVERSLPEAECRGWI